MRLLNFPALMSVGLMVMGASAVAAGSIQVSYLQPEKFSDIGISSHDRENAMGQLTQHFESLAKRYLADLGIPDSRMTTVSFGEENPAVQGGSEAAWAKNRRADFVLR